MGYSSNTRFIQYSDIDDTPLLRKTSKKLRNVYHLIYDSRNIVNAQYKAQLGKRDRTEIKRFNDNLLENLMSLYTSLKDETFSPGEYRIKTIYEPKERIIMIAPFFPDRIVHHCIINVLGEFWTNILISNTYACIKGRGIHKCMEDVNKALLSDKRGTKYCLKIDIRKFYDNVDHGCLKKIIRYTIADDQLLRLLDKIIDSNGKDVGLPIGNYTSQYLANLYLAYFDHFVKEDLKVKYYYRYMDDIVVLSGSKDELHNILDMMGLYLAAELKVEIEPNWQIFPVDSRGIDFVGFVQNHYGILLRKSILKRFYAKFNKISRTHEIDDMSKIKHLFPSEYGWISRCSEVHSKFIFNNCIKNGNKRIINRTTGKRKTSSN